MAARGPDGLGSWVAADARLGLGHRRLAIIDLSTAAAQPMHSACGRYVITFNGEIYNYKDLRRRLEARGRQFRTSSDTEVLLELYASAGADMVPELRGMFAFAIWDNERRTLFLARDPNGIKPLYYSDDGWTFRFASQVKALLAGGGCDSSPDPGGLAGFYMFGAVPEPLTMFRAIRALPAGTSVTIDRHGARAPQVFCSVAAIFRDSENATGGAGLDLHELGEALRDSVRHHLVADVPVGAFLSGGIDSGALVGLMRDAGQTDIRTLTLAFEEYAGTSNDEAPLAASVAELYGTKHRTHVVTAAELHRDFPRILLAMDQPSIDGFNTWFVSKAMRESGIKVAISGLGGDELFGGYPSFAQIPKLTRALALPARIPMLGRALRMAANKLALPSRFGIAAKSAGLLEYGTDTYSAYFLRRAVFMPWELPKIMGYVAAAEGLRRLDPVRHIKDAIGPLPHRPYAAVGALESAIYMRNQLLRDADWASMAHGLEVRVPLVDCTLQRAVAAYYATRAFRPGKFALAAAPGTPLPGTVVDRSKTGFTTPVADWLLHEGGHISEGSPPVQMTKSKALAMALAGSAALHSGRQPSDVEALV